MNLDAILLNKHVVMGIDYTKRWRNKKFAGGRLALHKLHGLCFTSSAKLRGVQMGFCCSWGGGITHNEHCYEQWPT